VPEWPSLSSGLALNPEAIKPRATGPQWFWAGRARDPFLTQGSHRGHTLTLGVGLEGIT